jgi:hypothetical protein
MRATLTTALNRPTAALLLACLLLWLPGGEAGVQSGRWSGYAATELRLFPQNPLAPGQHEENLSLVFEPEYYREWDNGRQSLTFVPFLRLDQHDDERTHADIRELTWLRVGEGWELRAGIRKVFWGVTEFLHLVDVINQTDFVENIDTEEKLGQPMLNVAITRDWGTLDFFLLPFFRERTFPGSDGRLRFLLPVDTDRARYESGVGRRHVDWAIRWFQTLGDWDIGVAHFSGTSREPRLFPDLSNPLDPVLLPVYDLMDQTSLDVQATKGDWLWKLEVLTRRVLGERSTALTGGFEYTFVGIFGTAVDLGILSEYLYDNRGDEAAPTPFEDDLAFGCRLVFNDVQSTELLVGVLLDRRSHAQFWNLEASRRLGSSWKLAVEGRAFERVSPEDLFFGFRRDDYIQVELAWYF